MTTERRLECCSHKPRQVMVLPHQELRKAWDRPSPPRAVRESTAWPTPGVWTSGLQNCRATQITVICCIRPRRLTLVGEEQDRALGRGNHCSAWKGVQLRTLPLKTPPPPRLIPFPGSLPHPPLGKGLVPAFPRALLPAPTSGPLAQPAARPGSIIPTCIS